jgi:hypothetical protein
MKTTQTLLLIAVLVILIGGVTFVRNWLRNPPTGTDGPQPILLDVIDVAFPVAMEHREQELNSHGHHDFCFHNRSAEPAEVGVHYQSCKCAKVEVLALTPDEEKGFQAAIRQWGDSQARSPSASFPAVGTLQALVHKVRKFLDDQPADRWHLIGSADEEHQSFVLPGNSTGFFRLTWQNKKLGPVAHGSKIWQQVPGDPVTRNPDSLDLRVPLTVVQPLRVNPAAVKMDELGPNQTYSFDTLCWSSTRKGFKLVSVKEEHDDPCFVAVVTPLTGEALLKAGEALETALPKDPSARHVVSAYRIDVTIHERLPNNGKQLDLGPLHRKLLLTTDQEDFPTLELAVQGMVRGDVTVGTEAQRDMIVLKTFPYRKGKSVTVPVESNQPDMILEIDSKKPDYLRVELEPRKELASPGRKRWDLTVIVPPNGPAGQLQDCFVKLKTNTDRYIRIPVVGRATESLDRP